VWLACELRAVSRAVDCHRNQPRDDGSSIEQWTPFPFVPDPAQPLCTLVESSTRCDSPELTSLQFDGADLSVKLEAKDGAVAKLVFRNAIGFRFGRVRPAGVLVGEAG
jgi:hypothetical protein